MYMLESPPSFLVFVCVHRTSSSFALHQHWPHYHQHAPLHNMHMMMMAVLAPRHCASVPSACIALFRMTACCLQTCLLFPDDVRLTLAAVGTSTIEALPSTHSYHFIHGSASSDLLLALQASLPQQKLAFRAGYESSVLKVPTHIFSCSLAVEECSPAGARDYGCFMGLQDRHDVHEREPHIRQCEHGCMRGTAPARLCRSLLYRLHQHSSQPICHSTDPGLLGPAAGRHQHRCDGHTANGLVWRKHVHLRHG